ncbi:MAG TPA: hypothetical protein IGS40_07765 [Trichormus sp. M33_DOE_039]|nr:hypothetical protein [Trichormus sp. M33_DOE_039]
MTDAIVPSKSEKIIVSVNRQNYKQVISQVVANRKIIEHRDIGDIVGIPAEDYVRGKPHTIKLSVMFFNYTTPPYTARTGQRFVRATYNIPDIKRIKLDWLTIKTACGGANGYLWGRFRATANLSNGRQVQIYGGSESEADERLKALMQLSDATITTLTIAEEKKEGRRNTNKRMYKETTRIYPAYFSVMNYEKIEVEDEREFSGLTSTLSGNFRRIRTEKIPLWVDKAPTNTQAIITEALRVRGVNNNEN